MAGYVINLNDKDALIQCFQTGNYSTNISNPKTYANPRGKIYPNYWVIHKKVL